MITEPASGHVLCATGGGNYRIVLAIAAIVVQRAITDRLINNDVAVTNLDVVQAPRIRANPCLVLDRSPLAPKIRERHQVALTALTALRKNQFQSRSPPSCSRILQSRAPPDTSLGLRALGMGGRIEGSLRHCFRTPLRHKRNR